MRRSGWPLDSSWLIAVMIVVLFFNCGIIHSKHNSDLSVQVKGSPDQVIVDKNKGGDPKHCCQEAVQMNDDKE
jgi:hypothetical protein